MPENGSNQINHTAGKSQRTGSGPSDELVIQTRHSREAPHSGEELISSQSAIPGEKANTASSICTDRTTAASSASQHALKTDSPSPLVRNWEEYKSKRGISNKTPEVVPEAALRTIIGRQQESHPDDVSTAQLRIAGVELCRHYGALEIVPSIADVDDNPQPVLTPKADEGFWKLRADEFYNAGRGDSYTMSAVWFSETSMWQFELDEGSRPLNASAIRNFKALAETSLCALGYPAGESCIGWLDILRRMRDGSTGPRTYANVAMGACVLSEADIEKLSRDGRPIPDGGTMEFLLMPDNSGGEQEAHSPLSGLPDVRIQVRRKWKTTIETVKQVFDASANLCLYLRARAAADTYAAASANRRTGSPHEALLSTTTSGGPLNLELQITSDRPTGINTSFAEVLRETVTWSDFFRRFNELADILHADGENISPDISPMLGIKPQSSPVKVMIRNLAGLSTRVLATRFRATAELAGKLLDPKSPDPLSGWLNSLQRRDRQLNVRELRRTDSELLLFRACEESAHYCLILGSENTRGRLIYRGLTEPLGSENGKVSIPTESNRGLSVDDSNLGAPPEKQDYDVPILRVSSESPELKAPLGSTLPGLNNSSEGFGPAAIAPLSLTEKIDPNHAEGLSAWEEIDIVFLSDERIHISAPNIDETRNYAELGFCDKRSEKPNVGWGILRALARTGGTIPQLKGDPKWPATEKQIERLRSTLREHFGLADDPLLLEKGTGYRSRFKIRCGLSFES